MSTPNDELFYTDLAHGLEVAPDAYHDAHYIYGELDGGPYRLDDYFDYEVAGAASNPDQAERRQLLTVGRACLNLELQESETGPKSAFVIARPGHLAAKSMIRGMMERGGIEVASLEPVTFSLTDRRALPDPLADPRLRAVHRQVAARTR